MNLKIIAVGTGRDGTVSLNELLNALFLSAGKDWVSGHEYGSRDTHKYYVEHREDNNSDALANLKKIFVDCHAQSIVGNGYAFVLPLLAEVFSGKLKLIHLQRRSRNDCVRSLTTLCEIFPQFSGNYCDVKNPVFRRIAAYHTDDMSRQQWNELELSKKNEWYYDKTHHLIEQSKNLFESYLHVYTEDLGKPETMTALADFLEINPRRLPDPICRNSFVFADIKSVDPFYRHKAQWMYRFFDVNKSVSEDLYALQYFYERFTMWTDYLITGFIHNINSDYALEEDKLVSLLDAAEVFFEKGLQEVKLLRRRADSAQ